MMFEPQSTLLFVVLLILFGVLIWWIVVTARVAFKVLAACLAFFMAFSFGVLAVNRYFDYYQTWGSAIADFTNAGPNSGPQVAASSLLGRSAQTKDDPTSVYLRLAKVQGYTVRLTVTGKQSHITRVAYVYLPPQYFQTAYKKYRFPVIELIHGQPGEPQDWINVVGVQVDLDDLVNRGLGKPAVLVMPDANGGEKISLQCLNQVGGPQDLTYLAVDLPREIAHILRVQPPGPAWGIAGYSEGGFCAANMALQFRRDYGYAAVMSGYFVPTRNQLTNPSRLVSPFGRNQKLRLANTPLHEVRVLKPGAYIPQFWLGAGKNDRADVANAEYFWQELELHQAYVPLILTPGGLHTMTTWRAEVPPMLIWMTTNLANEVIKLDRQLHARRAGGYSHRGPTKSGKPVNANSAKHPAPHSSSSV
jgi:enterochelin esterase-like enzyme